MHKVKLAALASELPHRKIGNDDPVFAAISSIPERWWRFWGIKQRGHLDRAAGESELRAAEVAARRILERMQLDADDVDLLICSSSCPILKDSSDLPSAEPRLFPRLSGLLARRLGLARTLAFDTQAECAGFMLNLSIGASYIRSGLASNVLVVCSESVSDLLDPTARASTIFADGCVAALLTRSAPDEDADLLANAQYGNADYYELATATWRYQEADSAGQGEVGLYFSMNEDGPKDIQDFAPKHVPIAVHRALASAGLGADDIAYLVLHQASPFLVQCWGSGIGCSAEKYDFVAGDTGVMVSVAVAHALYTALVQEKIKPGDVVALGGAGLGWTFLGQVWKFGHITIC